MNKIMTAELAAKKKRYNALICTYETRRRKLREYHGITDCARPDVTPAYRKEVVKINAKLKTWKQGLRKIKAISERINGVEDIEKAVVKFIGAKIKNTNGYHLPPEVKLGKSIFYKFALENGYKGSYIVDFMGGTHRYQAQDYRKRFTKSFSTNPKNKEIWVQFKIFYNESIKAA